MAATWDDVKRIGLELPEVEVGTWNNGPALKVRGKSFCRLRDDEQDIVLMVDMLEREALMQSEPEMFHITPHYKDYPAMLVRLATVDPEMLREQIIESWLRKAPKRLVKSYLDGAAGG